LGVFGVGLTIPSHKYIFCEEASKNGILEIPILEGETTRHEQ
jgi:hypothetical protein